MNSKETDTSSSADVANQVAAYAIRARDSIKQNNLIEAKAIIVELMTLDEQLLNSAELTVVNELLDVVITLLPSKEYQNLEQLFLKGLGILQSHKNAKPLDLVIPLNNLMVLYEQVANAEGRNQVANNIIAIAEELIEPVNTKTAQVFLQLGGLYEKSAQYQAADILYKQVNRFMMEDPEVSHDTLLAWLSNYSRVLISLGQFELAMEYFEHALAKLDENSKADDIERIRTLSTMAGCAFSKGDNAKAEIAFEQALQIAEQTGHQDGLLPSAICHNLATLYLQHNKPELYDKAEELINRSLAMVKKAGKQVTAEYAGGLSQLAVIAENRGKLDRAEQLYHESFQVYEQASDTDKDEYSDFVTDAGFLYIKREQPHDAVEMFQRALQLRESTADESANRLANAMSNLALAHFKSDKLDDAISVYRKAIDVRNKALTKEH